jgi:hypothetical protein
MDFMRYGSRLAPVFSEKTQKTPGKEIVRAIKIKKEYYEEKKKFKKP